MHLIYNQHFSVQNLSEHETNIKSVTETVWQTHDKKVTILMEAYMLQSHCVSSFVFFMRTKIHSSLPHQLHTLLITRSFLGVLRNLFFVLRESSTKRSNIYSSQYWDGEIEVLTAKCNLAKH